MKSLRRYLLERLVGRRPRHALQLSCASLDVVGLELRLPPQSPLYSPNGGTTVELPVDDVIAPFVLDHGQWQTEELQFISAHMPAQPHVLIDVGANIGLITRQLMHAVPNIAAAVCYEPHPGNFRRLQRNLAHLPHCHLVQAAVGATGDLVFYEEVNNAGNYSLNLDAMRGKQYRRSAVRGIAATEAAIVSVLPETQRALPLIWKSDTQGFDEVIVASLPDTFWARVECGVMEVWRIERPVFDRDRLGSILATFPVRRFGDDFSSNVSVEEILSYSHGTDYGHRDLFFARQ